MELGEIVSHKAPFGSRIQVILQIVVSSSFFLVYSLIAHFCTKLIRFYVFQRFLSPKINSPASTSYDDPRTAFESTKRLTGLNKTPFGQASSRFKLNRQAKFLPGTYVPYACSGSDLIHVHVRTCRSWGIQ